MSWSAYATRIQSGTRQGRGGRESPEPLSSRPSTTRRRGSGERWPYELGNTCDSIRPVPRARASAMVVDESRSKTQSPSVNPAAVELATLPRGEGASSQPKSLVRLRSRPRICCLPALFEVPAELGDRGRRKAHRELVARHCGDGSPEA